MSNEKKTPDRKPPGGNPLAKVRFEIPQADQRDFESELVWAEFLGSNRYRLRNSPFAVFGFSCDDEVLAVEKDGAMVVAGIYLRGGHSTYRLSLAEGVDLGGSRFSEHWLPMERLGCTYENANSRLLSIDVPPSVDIYKAYSLLELGEKEGVWDFEEAHCGHPLRPMNGSN